MPEQILKNLEGLKALDAIVVKKAIQDLRQGGQFMIQTARYFFLDGQGIDESDPLTFQALCSRNNIDPNRAAKLIWRKLSQKTQNELLCFFKQASYEFPKTN
ncbi:MAG: hypothetical protein HYX20_02585 [Candidatus Yanofskybacteria bacterium]|nr:hypothetical protein [Candidatus Yanofskybacteria bacterium]